MGLQSTEAAGGYAPLTVCLSKESLGCLGKQNKRGGILKHSIPVAYISEDMAINQDIKALIPKEGIDYYYLLSYLKYKEKELFQNLKCKT